MRRLSTSTEINLFNSAWFSWSLRLVSERYLFRSLCCPGKSVFLYLMYSKWAIISTQVSSSRAVAVYQLLASQSPDCSCTWQLAGVNMWHCVSVMQDIFRKMTGRAPWQLRRSQLHMATCPFPARQPCCMSYSRLSLSAFHCQIKQERDILTIHSA